MKTICNSLPSALLILLFIYAAASKLLEFHEFQNQLRRQAFPGGFADVLAVLLPAAELLTVVLLLIPKTFLTGLQLSLSLLIVFSGYVALIILHWWREAPCSCGGILNHMSWNVHLMFNSIFIILNLVAINIHFKERRQVKKR